MWIYEKDKGQSPKDKKDAEMSFFYSVSNISHAVQI